MAARDIATAWHRAQAVSWQRPEAGLHDAVPVALRAEIAAE